LPVILYCFEAWSLTIDKTYTASKNENKEKYTVNEIMGEKMYLQVSQCNTNVFKKSVINMGIRSYNKIPASIKKVRKL
jgi:hypothetical protein